MEMSETGKTVYERTYSRVKPNGERETWPETVHRVVDGNLALAGHHLDNERDDLIRMMTEFKIIPAGRHLWASGVKGRQYLMNCWVSGWDVDPSPTNGVRGSEDRASLGPTEHFRFSFLRLMEGGGVGANYSNRYLNEYPVLSGAFRVHIVCSPEHPDYERMLRDGILSPEFDAEWPGAFPVEDSREGWADALTDLLRTYYGGAEHTDRVYDVSRVRGEGARLATFGGRASGPLPLGRMLREVAEVMNREQVLTGLSAMEIDHAIAKCVVSGGNRRSARMSIMRWDDPEVMEFIRCKANGGHWTTNISVEVDDEFWHPGPYQANEAREVFDAIAGGMLSNGEPGFWDSSLSNVGEPNRVTCTNPCTTDTTWILTTNGPRQVYELIGKPFVAVVDGKPYNSTREGFFKTGNKPVYKLATDEGWEAEVTADHEVYRPNGERVEVQHLNLGDKIKLSDHRTIVPWEGPGSDIEGYTLGWLVGDGTFGPHAILQSQGKPETEFSRAEIERYALSLPHRSDFGGWAGPYSTGQMRLSSKSVAGVAASYGVVKGNKTVTEDVERGSYEFTVGFLRGLFDTDGHVEFLANAGVSVRLSSSDRPALSAVQRMLSRLGIRASVRGMHDAKDMECPNTGNTYEAKPSYRLLITNRQNVKQYHKVIGFWHRAKQAKLVAGIDAYEADRETKFEATFAGIEYARDDNVYDCTIDSVYDFCGNGLYMRDCGEQCLEPWEPCNLGHVNLAAFDDGNGQTDFAELRLAHKLVTRFLIRATYGDVTDSKAAAVLARNRRIGVGHLGVATYLARTEGLAYSEAADDEEFRLMLTALADGVDAAAANYCHQLRIPVPVKTRTVAPTGTIAKMPGVSEGIHPIFAKYFIRRIRFSDVDEDQRATVERYRAEGYSVAPCQYAPSTSVVSIPTMDTLVPEVDAIYGEEEADVIVESTEDLSIRDMLGFQAMYQQLWADNAVSYTVNVDPDRYSVAELTEVLTEFGGKLKGVTVFPETSMPQAPYERLTREEYESYQHRHVEDSVNEDCVSGACPVR